MKTILRRLFCRHKNVMVIDDPKGFITPEWKCIDCKKEWK